MAKFSTGIKFLREAVNNCTYVFLYYSGSRQNHNQNSIPPNDAIEVKQGKRSETCGINQEAIFTEAWMKNEGEEQ